MLDYTLINDDVIVQGTVGGYKYYVMVFCPAAHNWVIYNSFDLKSDAIAWAKIPENVK